MKKEQKKWNDSYLYKIENKKINKKDIGLLWHIDSYEESFLLSSKSDVISSLVSILVENHLQRNPFSHSQTVFSKQQSRYAESVHRKHVLDTAYEEENYNNDEIDNDENSDFEFYTKDFHDNDNNNNNKNNNENNNKSNNNNNNTININITNRDQNKNTEYIFETKKESVFRPKPEAAILWSKFPLNDALTKLKEQRPEAASSLTYVQYIILPARTSTTVCTGMRTFNRNKNKNNKNNNDYNNENNNGNENVNYDEYDDEDESDDGNGDGNGFRDLEPKRLQRSPKSTSFSTSISSSHSVFGIDGLSRIRLLYTAPWPISILITPDLLKITLKSTKRLLEIAQLSALVRIVWSDMRRGKSSSSPTPASSRITSKMLLPSHTRKLSMTEIRAGPTSKVSLSSTSTSTSTSTSSKYERDCSRALHLVQQSVLPLGDFTSDRIRTQQLKFRKHLLDASNNGFEGIKYALMCYAVNISTAIFSDNEDEKDIDDDGNEDGNETQKEEIQQYDEFSIKSNSNNKFNYKNITNLNDIIDEDDLSISDLISLLLASCRNVLRVIEFTTIKISELNDIKEKNYDNIKKSENFNQINPIYQKNTLDKRIQKEKQMMIEIKVSVDDLIKCRKNLFSAVKRIAKEENNSDALVFLLFFNE